ncbi:MAG: hypothetical protein HY037_05345 [Nitrospirae bacterium]|nr:hypothetical protein [Candidatus Troglogloeales bacterium]
MCKLKKLSGIFEKPDGEAGGAAVNRKRRTQIPLSRILGGCGVVKGKINGVCPYFN